MESLRIEKLNVLKELINFNKILQQKIYQSCVDEVKELFEINIECIEKLNDVIEGDIDAEFKKIADLYLRFVRSCSDSFFLTRNWGTLIKVQDMFVDGIVQTYQLMKKGDIVCACCGKHTFFEPLPRSYDFQLKKYESVPHVYETLNKEEYICPRCMAADRDRLILSFLKKINLPCMKKGIKILQIAPSAAIEEWIISNCPNVDYESTDLYMENVTFRSDISDMSMIADDTYDFFICSHVMEHVQDDRKGMEELQRILKLDGIGIFLVPIALDLEEIDEEWGLSPEENWKRFGQDDHCRIYTRKGVIDRLEKAGFFVHPVGKEFFGEKLFSENAFTDTSTLYLLNKSHADLEELMKSQEEKSDIDNYPLVSVIMSCYNHEKFVADAIESVINQTYKNIEFLVADDGSSDHSVEVMKQYSEYFAEAHYFEENYGGQELFLHGRTKGKYVALINSDDVWERDKLEKQVKFLEHNPDYAACFTWTNYVNDDLEIIVDELFIKANRSPQQWMYFFFKQGNCLCHPSILIRRAPYIDGFKYSYFSIFRQLPDFSAWVRLVQKEKIYIMPQVLVKMRRHPLGCSENVSAATEKTYCRQINEYMFLWYKEIRDMDIGFFKETFAKDFVNPNAESKEEIMCEKYFLLKNQKDVWYDTAAILLLFDICNDPEVRKCLSEKYHYKNKDIFDEYLNVGLGPCHVQIKKLQKEIAELKNNINGQ